MQNCKGIFGKLFGHNFNIYDIEDDYLPTTFYEKIDYDLLILSKHLEKYGQDIQICKRCGAQKEVKDE